MIPLHLIPLSCSPFVTYRHTLVKLPTVSFILRADKRRKDGTAPVYCRVYYGGRSRYTSTGVRIKPGEWNARTQRVKSSCDLAELFNRQLDNLNATATGAALDAGSAQEVVDALNGASDTLTGYVERMIEGMNESGQYWDRLKYTSALGKLHEVFGDPIGWRALTPEALRRYERYMRETRGNSPNTVKREMSRLRTIVRRAIRDGVLNSDRNPFDRYTMPKGEAVEKRHLVLGELQALAALELEEGTRLRIVRDAFLVAIYGGGLRVSDLLLLTEKNIVDGRIKLRMQKTRELHNLELPPAALDVLRPYQRQLHERMLRPPSTQPYPYLFLLLQQGNDDDKEDVRRRQHRCTAKINKALKRLALLAGIGSEGMSSHVARRTFANLARQSGDVYEVMHLLGHRDIATTRKYLASLSTEAGDEVTRRIWAKAEKGSS